MNLVTVIFWQLVQATLIIAVGAIEQRTGAVIALAPAIVWEIMIVIVAAGNLAWTLIVAVYGDPGDLPNVRGAIRSLLFPPPPAAKRAAYASRTTRQRRIVP